MAHRIGAIERDRVPAALRIQAPAEMRDGMTVHVVGIGAIAVEPVAHQLGVEPAFDLPDKAVADFEPHLVLHVTAIGQDDNVAGRENDRAVGRAFVRERVHVPGAPMVETAGRFRIAVLDHGWVFAGLDGQIGPAGPGDAHRLGALQSLARVRDCLLQPRRRHQLLQFVGSIDHHQRARAGVARLLQPAGEQRDVQADQHVGRLDGLKRALAAADRLHPHFGPRWHRVDAHLVSVGAKVFGGGKGRGHVIAPRPQIAQKHDGFALLHIAELEFVAKQHRKFGVIDGFGHGAAPFDLLNVLRRSLARDRQR